MEKKGICIDVLGDISLAYWEQVEDEALYLAKMINEQLEEVDYRIANLEAPIVEEEIFPIDKSGPNLKTDKRYICFFKELHIDGYALANNHLGDYGVSGIEETINTLENLGKDYVGAALEVQKLYKPLRKEINGIKISVFSVCENEFGVSYDEQIGAAGYNKEILRKLIKEERAWADYKIIIFHGGTEHNPFPSPKQKFRYRELIEFGADAVIGMHTHCPQGYEVYKGKIIVYSTGNFFFPEKCETPFDTWKIGYIARLYLNEKELDFEFIPYKFDIHGRQFELVKKEDFGKYIEEISAIIQDQKRLDNLYKSWVTMSGKMYLEQLCKSISNLDDRKNLAVVKNMFSCEAHDELMNTYMNMLYNDEIERYRKYKGEIKKYINFFTEKTVRQKKDEKQLSQIDAIIWGVGKKAELLYMKMSLEGKRVVFVDKNPLKQGLFFKGESIISPEEVMYYYQNVEIYLCVSEKSALEVQEFLRTKKMQNVIRIFEE